MNARVGFTTIIESQIFGAGHGLFIWSVIIIMLAYEPDAMRPYMIVYIVIVTLAKRSVHMRSGWSAGAGDQ